jgi:hypothetical protein
MTKPKERKIKNIELTSLDGGGFYINGRPVVMTPVDLAIIQALNEIIDYLNEQRTQLLKEIKKMHQIPFPELNDAGRKTNADYMADGYNQAISDILKLLNK